MRDLGRAPVNGRSATHCTAVSDRAHKGRFEKAFGSENALLGAFFITADSGDMTEELTAAARQQS